MSNPFEQIMSNPELFKVASTHHFHGNECLCGFASPVSRQRTEHIMHETLATAALAEVTIVESIPAKINLISWEGRHELDADLAPDETLVVLTVKTDRSWSLGDKAELTIHRPEGGGDA